MLQFNWTVQTRVMSVMTTCHCCMNAQVTLYTTAQYSVHCLICYIAIASQVALFCRVFLNRYLKIKELL
jgi:ribosomal protein S27E